MSVAHHRQNPIESIYLIAQIIFEQFAAIFVKALICLALAD
jgi:hypothetical protein